MGDYRIVTDSRCHLPPELLGRWGVSVAETGDGITRCFEAILGQEKDILYVSSSDSAGDAHSAAAELKKNWPCAGIRILDTRTAGGIPVYLAAAKGLEGASLEENFRWLSGMLPRCLGCFASGKGGKWARRRAVKALADRYTALALPERNTPVFISHGQCRQAAEMLADLLMERHGVEVTLINRIAPGSGDPGTLALFFLGQPR